MSALLLSLACIVAFRKPVWGFGIILLTTSTLFHLDQYFIVPLPLGYVEVTEALLVSMITAIWLRRWATPRPRRTAISNRGVSGPPGVNTWAAIGPYCLWQTVCIVFTLPHWAGTEHFRLAIRFLISGVLPWISLCILQQLPISAGRKVFRIAYYLTLLTAVFHITLQTTDFRALMKPAYWWIPKNSEYSFGFVQQWIDQEAFVRGLPQGILLILFFALLKTSEFILGRERQIKRSAIAAAILFSALFITVTRSLIVCFSAGIVILLMLGAFTFRLRMNHILRVSALLVVFVGAALLYNALRPGFFNFWSARVEQLAGADSEIFSEDNAARGRDNLAAMAAISDHPMLGLGTPRYPDEYSFRIGPPTDTHPMLEAGMVGGIPAMLLLLWLEVCLFLPSLRKAWSDPNAALELAPFIAILMMSAFAVNMIGGGGTIIGPQILYVTIFTNEMWTRCSRPRFAGPFQIQKDKTWRSPAYH